MQIKERDDPIWVRLTSRRHSSRVYEASGHASPHTGSEGREGEGEGEGGGREGRGERKREGRARERGERQQKGKEVLVIVLSSFLSLVFFVF